MTRIEPQSPDHAEGLFAALSDPAIYRWLDEAPPESLLALRARLERLQSGGSADGTERWFNWTVFHQGKIVGYVQATAFAQGATSIAYVLNPAVWGQSVAYDACSQMLAQLCAEIAPQRFTAEAERGNIRSHRLLRRLGFAETGTVGGEVQFAADPEALTTRRDSP